MNDRLASTFADQLCISPGKNFLRLLDRSERMPQCCPMNITHGLKLTRPNPWDDQATTYICTCDQRFGSQVQLYEHAIEANVTRDNMLEALERLLVRIRHNSTDLGELGTFIKVEYVENFIDQIKKGAPGSGTVQGPDKMLKVYLLSEAK